MLELNIKVCLGSCLVETELGQREKWEIVGYVWRTEVDVFGYGQNLQVMDTRWVQRGSWGPRCGYLEGCTW